MLPEVKKAMRFQHNFVIGVEKKRGSFSTQKLMKAHRTKMTRNNQYGRELARNVTIFNSFPSFAPCLFVHKLILWFRKVIWT